MKFLFATVLTLTLLSITGCDTRARILQPVVVQCAPDSLPPAPPPPDSTECPEDDEKEGRRDGR